ncbi:MAG: Hpt domain-containing protein, partial [Aquabacterium sp.]
ADAPAMLPGATSSDDRTPPADVNADAFWAHYSGQPGLRARLVAALCHTVPELMKQLEEAERARDAEAAARVLHNVKGTGLNLHAPMLTAQAITGLTQARTGVPLLWETVEEVAASLDALMTALRALSEEASAVEAAQQAQGQ